MTQGWSWSPGPVSEDLEDLGSVLPSQVGPTASCFSPSLPCWACAPLSAASFLLYILVLCLSVFPVACGFGGPLFKFFYLGVIDITLYWFQVYSIVIQYLYNGGPSWKIKPILTWRSSKQPVGQVECWGFKRGEDECPETKSHEGGMLTGEGGGVVLWVPICLPECLVLSTGWHMIPNKQIRRATANTPDLATQGRFGIV